MSSDRTDDSAVPDKSLPPMRMRLGAAPATWGIVASQATATSACSMTLIGGVGAKAHSEVMWVGGGAVGSAREGSSWAAFCERSCDAASVTWRKCPDEPHPRVEMALTAAASRSGMPSTAGHSSSTAATRQPVLIWNGKGMGVEVEQARLAAAFKQSISARLGE